MLAETETHSGGYGEGGEGRSIEDVMETTSCQEVDYINDTYWFRYVDRIVGESRAQRWSPLGYVIGY
jgi:hypothetical protein